MDAFAAESAATLRLNFRGTGASGGAHDGGRGEVEDARAAVAYAAAALPDRPLLLAGYSFGAMVAAGLAAGGAGVAGLVLVSPPFAYGALPALPAGVQTLAIGGDEDPVCPADRLAALAGGIAVRIVSGADHGWSSGMAELATTARAFARNLTG